VTPTLRTSLGRSLVGVLAVLALASGLGLVDALAGASDDGLIVLVSGRDDHGMETFDELPLHDRPGGEVVAMVPTDTLARVHATDGTWLDITTLEGRAVRGWIDEFLVRGDLHIVLPDAPACGAPTEQGHLPPSARVRVVDVHADDAGGLELVGVVPVGDEREHHVARHWVRELPGPAPRAGAECTEVPDVELGHGH
jgi:hypothetical protein